MKLDENPTGPKISNEKRVPSLLKAPIQYFRNLLKRAGSPDSETMQEGNESESPPRNLREYLNDPNSMYTGHGRQAWFFRSPVKKIINHRDHPEDPGYKDANYGMWRGQFCNIVNNDDLIVIFKDGTKVATRDLTTAHVRYQVTGAGAER
ncbi:hypothetical protein COV82_02300 [Candidatus Peregrinibacteria bacterium CG11_big_fil_rev_8_21_14_0_20_46_8]|nr:MAG: hypothetical protein COV82_02300 [Candidatus Peregrinibacteria bacterium CG11_big_fil_rev_8_21_14_0_20_46_8]